LGRLDLLTGLKTVWFARPYLFVNISSEPPLRLTHRSREKRMSHANLHHSQRTLALREPYQSFPTIKLWELRFQLLGLLGMPHAPG